ncbi:PREDICTED: guanine nucleotide-binding protein-like 1 [Nicrophorus vespilloides]|uniref:Guanine nucleotide-binding protein-like 1 n=1 Tax=Nicrophorus vespilloides TaxID=110193 RepID=A0ABM1N026_NICVS|nr:PREDICTED: guanine nucleotide-binding protein-like 1 [Nicrophorus vespilloides]
MPQGRKKVPFSGKAKKEQLKTKRNKKQGSSQNYLVKPHNSDGDDSDDGKVQKVNAQPGRSGRNVNRYNLKFYRETDAEIKERKELAMKSLEMHNDLEINVHDYFPEDFDFPKRPSWNFDMSREALDARENRYFTEYVTELDNKYGWKEMSFFELNLETWRQLWRVLEMSDVILIIVDIRFPALMFPPSLYNYVTKTLNKQMILVMNKIDLAPTPLVVAWRNYFIKNYPQLKVVLFTTLPQYNLVGKLSDKAGLQIRHKKGKVRMATEGTKLLLEACKEIVEDQVDLRSWEEKIKEESTYTTDDVSELIVEETIETKSVDTQFYQHERFNNGILTIGCVGQPNVGKSSVMNAIMGKKVVSVSKTPGHTKHFQTIFLTPNVRLCDCPGLVFPSKVPKVLQIIMGSFPIAQLREPFTTIKYLAERMDMPKLLRIAHPENDDTWSAMDVCDGWAKRCGYVTARSGRLDSYRAANSLLRMTLDGKICLCLTPPNYESEKDVWEKHEDVEMVNWIKAIVDDDDDKKQDRPLEKVAESCSDEDAFKDSDEERDEYDDDSSDGEQVLASNKFSALNDAN